MEPLKLKMLPLTIRMFKKNFNVIISGIDLIIEAYTIYLDSNKDIHHYGDKSLEEWREEQIETFTRYELSKLNPEGIE